MRGALMPKERDFYSGHAAGDVAATYGENLPAALSDYIQEPTPLSAPKPRSWRSTCAGAPGPRLAMGTKYALDLEQTTRAAMERCCSSPQAAREATLRLHDAGELDASAADIAKLKTLRL